MPVARSSLANLTPGGRKVAREDDWREGFNHNRDLSLPCLGCQHDGYGPTPLHSCEAFPLPQWVPTYLAHVDLAVADRGSVAMLKVIREAGEAGHRF